jgi:hypothetical protein
MYGKITGPEFLSLLMRWRCALGLRKSIEVKAKEIENRKMQIGNAGHHHPRTTADIYRRPSSSFIGTSRLGALQKAHLVQVLSGGGGFLTAFPPKKFCHPSTSMTKLFEHLKIST